MIQSRWIEPQSTEFTSVVPSSGLTNSAKAMLRHNRDSKFSNRVIRHGGPVISQSMDASSRAKKLEKSALRKSSNSVDSRTADFEKEAASLLMLHQRFLRDQQELEQEAKRFFAARAIQCMFRKRKARKKLQRLKAIRFLSLCIFFRSYFRRRKAAAKRLVQFARTCKIRASYHATLRTVRAAKKIQRKYRAFRIRRSTSTFMVRCSVMKNLMRHVLLFGSRKAYHQIKQLRFILAHGKERVAVRNLISAWRRKRRAQVFSGPNGKMVYLTLAYLNTSIEYTYNPFYNKRRNHLVANSISSTDGGENGTTAATPSTPDWMDLHFAPPPTPNEPHYSNMVIDYIKHKVEIQHAIEQQSRRKHQGGRHLYPKRNMHVRGKVVMLPTNSIEQSALANVLTGEKMVYAQDNHRHFSKEEIARLGYGGKLITPMYTRDQLPDELIGIWGPKSFADVILMIVDMKRIAVDNPNLVDDGSLTGTAGSPIVSRMSGKFKRRELNGKSYFVNDSGLDGVVRASSPSSTHHRDTNMSTVSTMSTMSTSSVSSHMSHTPTHRVLDSAGSKAATNNRLHHFPEEDGKPPVDPKKSAKNGSAASVGKLKPPKGATGAVSKTPVNKKQPPAKVAAAAAAGGAGGVLPSETSNSVKGNKQGPSTNLHEEDPRVEIKQPPQKSQLRISTELNPEDFIVSVPSGDSLQMTPLSAAFKQTFGFLNSTTSSFMSENGDVDQPEIPEVELQLPSKSLRFANDFVMKARTTALMLNMINNATAPSADTPSRSATNDAAAEATLSFINQARSSLVMVKPNSSSSSNGLSTTPSFMSARTINNKASAVMGDILKAARKSVMQTTINNRRALEPPPAPSLESIVNKFTTVKNKGISFGGETDVNTTSEYTLKARSSVMTMPHTPPGVKPANVTKKAAAFSMAPTVTLESLSLLYDTAAAASIPEEPALVAGSALDGNSVVELPVDNNSEYSMNFEAIMGSLVDDPDFNIQLENSDFAIQIDDSPVDTPTIDRMKAHLPPFGSKGQGALKSQPAVTNALPQIKRTGTTSATNSRPSSGNVVTHFPEIPLSDDEGGDHSDPHAKHAHLRPTKPVASHTCGDNRPRPGRKIV